MTTRPVPHTKRRISLLLVTSLLAITNIGAAKSGDARAEEKSEGFKCLIAGHSFFCPVAIAFDRIARRNEFPQHDMQIVFRGGQSGTAGAMWISPGARKEVTEILAEGDIELFGLTPGLTDNAETFQRWFDLALMHNPDTRFFIGIPWAIGGHGMKTDRYDRVIEGYAAMGAEIVKELRERYPENRIDYLSRSPSEGPRHEAHALTPATQ